MSTNTENQIRQPISWAQAVATVEQEVSTLQQTEDLDQMMASVVNASPMFEVIQEKLNASKKLLRDNFNDQQLISSVTQDLNNIINHPKLQNVVPESAINSLKSALETILAHQNQPA